LGEGRIFKQSSCRGAIEHKRLKTTELDGQKRNFAPILIITEAKLLIFCVQTNWVCPSGTQRFCKTDSDSSLESLTVCVIVIVLCNVFTPTRKSLDFQHASQ